MFTFPSHDRHSPNIATWIVGAHPIGRHTLWLLGAWYPMWLWCASKVQVAFGVWHASPDFGALLMPNTGERGMRWSPPAAKSDMHTYRFSPVYSGFDKCRTATEYQNIPSGRGVVPANTTQQVQYSGCLWKIHDSRLSTVPLNCQAFDLAFRFLTLGLD